MGLLRVPPAERIGCQILSYHHGDPRRFRGRPAGFYELLSGESQIGQVVQILSNALDAGKVVAYAETKAYPHSYRNTLIEAFRRSPLLLRTAVCASGSETAIRKPGVASLAWMPACLYRRALPSHWNNQERPGRKGCRGGS